MLKKTRRYFDRLEDDTRALLSRHPIPYALVGAIGIVLVWKGVWETAEMFPFLVGPVSFILGVGILLATGLLVSFFIGDSIIMSGYKHDKKLVEKTAKEVKSEMDILQELTQKIDRLEHTITSLKDPGKLN
jgi:hypothetical protein